MKISVLIALVITATVLVAGLAAAIAFGGPTPPPPMASINDPFKAVDFTDLPPLRFFVASDGESLAYREYRTDPAATKGSIVLVHGSSGSSNSMHPLAKAFAQAGYLAYALDIRGHGASGTKGTISYIGQLEDDLEVFTRSVELPEPATLAGFSSGGGFVLRFAGSTRQQAFESYLLLSPFLSPDAPNFRPGSGGWVDIGIPRIIALTLLNVIGIRAFNDLPVTSFALSEDAKSFLTPEYSFALAANFQPPRDYEKTIRSANQTCAVIAGTEDEAFRTDQLADIFRKQGKDWPVTLLPGIGHIPLTLEPAALDAAVSAVEHMRSNKT